MNVDRSHYERLCERADRIAEHAPTFTLDRQIADARETMGEDRRAQLRAEFDAVALSKEDYHG